jgi:hypothetical protein
MDGFTQHLQNLWCGDGKMHFQRNFCNGVDNVVGYVLLAIGFLVRMLNNKKRCEKTTTLHQDQNE